MLHEVLLLSVSITCCSLFVGKKTPNQPNSGSVKFTVDSENNLGWNGPLEMIWSSPLVRASLIGSGCSGLCPAESRTPPRTEMPQSLHATCLSV